MKWLRTFFYYLTAFAGGALAWGVSYYIYKKIGASMDTLVPPSEDSYYLIVAIVPILQNALPQLLAAIVLRKVARRMKWTAWWQWLLAGTVISLVVVFAFNRLGLAIEAARLPLAWQPLKIGLFFALMGPIMVSVLPIWVTLAAVSASSLMLWVVQHGIGQKR